MFFTVSISKGRDELAIGQIEANLRFTADPDELLYMIIPWSDVIQMPMGQSIPMPDFEIGFKTRSLHLKVCLTMQGSATHDSPVPFERVLPAHNDDPRSLTKKCLLSWP